MGCSHFTFRMPMALLLRLCSHLVILQYYSFFQFALGLFLSCFLFFFILLQYGTMLRISFWNSFGLLLLLSCCCFLPFLPFPSFICLMRLAHRFPLLKFKVISDTGCMRVATSFLPPLRVTCLVALFACFLLTPLYTCHAQSFSVC